MHKRSFLFFIVGIVLTSSAHFQLQSMESQNQPELSKTQPAPPPPVHADDQDSDLQDFITFLEAQPGNAPHTNTIKIISSNITSPSTGYQHLLHRLCAKHVSNNQEATARLNAYIATLQKAANKEKYTSDPDFLAQELTTRTFNKKILPYLSQLAQHQDGDMLLAQFLKLYPESHKEMRWHIAKKTYDDIITGKKTCLLKIAIQKACVQTFKLIFETIAEPAQIQAFQAVLQQQSPAVDNSNAHRIGTGIIAVSCFALPFLVKSKQWGLAATTFAASLLVPHLVNAPATDANALLKFIFGGNTRYVAPAASTVGAMMCLLKRKR